MNFYIDRIILINGEISKDELINNIYNLIDYYENYKVSENNYIITSELEFLNIDFCMNFKAS